MSVHYNRRKEVFFVLPKKYGKRKLYRTNYNPITKKTYYSWDELLEIYMFAKESEGIAETTLINKKDGVKLFFKF